MCRRLTTSLSVYALAVALTGIGWLALAPAAQAVGPAMTITLSPATIRADGASTTIATATVTDMTGAGVDGETIVFTSSGGQVISPTSPVGNGTGMYTATITSDTTPGPSTITATDQSVVAPPPPAMATLNEGGSTTNLAAYPSTVITNAPVTIIAVVSGTFSGSPLGTVTFYNRGIGIPGCTVVPLNPYAACQTTFSAASSPEQVSATFTPDTTSAASTAAGSSGAASLTIGTAATSISLDPSSVAPNVGGSVTYTASVAANQSGPFVPTGTVQFQDGGTPISSCSSVPLASSSNALAAVCTIHYSSPGKHKIVALYSGDGNFSSSSSNSVPLAVLRPQPGRPIPIVTSAMQWNFFFTPKFTTIRSLVLFGASSGTDLVMTCHGRGCPFAKRTKAIVKGIRCTPTGKHRCRPHRGPIDLTPAFHKHRIHVGTRITIEILRPGWIGKFYAFVIRPALPPSVRISCLAPGATRPGVGC